MIGDILVKVLSGNPITEEEKLRLRLWGDSAELYIPYILGLQSGTSNIFANSIKTNNDAFTRIYYTFVESDTASLTINIPTNTNNLLLVGGFQTDRAAYNDVVGCRINGDSGNNYSEQYEGAQATTQVQGSNASQSYAKLCIASGDSANDYIYGGFFAYIPNAKSNYYKSVIGISGMPEYTSTEAIIHTFCTFWSNTAPITSLTIVSANSANIKSGSTVSVYGLI